MLLCGRLMLCLGVAIRFRFVAAFHAVVLAAGSRWSLRETRRRQAMLARSANFGSSVALAGLGVS